MFDQLDLSPMVVVLLLLYGLLLAVCLVVWTALDMGGRRKTAATEVSRKKTEVPGNSRQDRPAQQTPIAQAAWEQRSDAAPAVPVTGSPAQRRAADSESVVSYSVRQRVTAPATTPPPSSDRPATAPVTDRRAKASRSDPAAAAPEPVPTPSVRPPDTGTQPTRSPGQDFPVGRSSRQPRGDGSTVTPPAGQSTAGHSDSGRTQTARPGKSEDAFERFLRSSSNDNDDY